MFPHWAYIVGSVLTSAAATTIGILWRRYRNSAGKELQPFRSYVLSSLWLLISRRLRPSLARLFGARPYAEVKLKVSERRMLVPSRGEVDLDIERAYVRLGLSSSPDSKIDDEALLNASGSRLLFGEPGSGKSSLTRKLYREALQRAYLQPSTCRLPLRFELGELPWDKLPAEAADQVTWLREILRASVAEVSRVNKGGFVFDAFAHGPGLILFLDGLDEVPPDKLEQVQALVGQTVSDLLHDAPETLVVVTARAQLKSVLTRSFIGAFGEVLTVTPFTPADVFAFLRRWEFPPDQRLTEIHRIFEHLRGNATLFAMCTNPLVLAMYVAEDQYQTRTTGSAVRLADTRSKFYDQVVGELLYYRRQDQRHRDRPMGGQLLSTRSELLGRIALDHLLNSHDPANVLSLTQAAATAQKYWHMNDPDQAATDLIDLAVETGLVSVQRQSGTLQFIHLSIAEYLAGKELAERPVKDLRKALSRVAADDPDARRLWETVVFAVALSKRDVRDQALRQLVDEGAPAELTLHVVRELQAYDLAVFREVVLSTTTDIVARPVEAWDAEWLARVRLVVSCLGDAHRLAEVRRPVDVPTVRAWLTALVDDDRGRFDHIFSLYLAANPAEALRVADELKLRDLLFVDRERIVTAMENPDVIALGMRMVTEDVDDAGTWIEVLAEAALRFELVAQLLREETTVLPHLAARAAAVESRHAWHAAGPAAGTFYGAVLASATARARPMKLGDGPRLVGRVDLLALVKPTDGGRSFVRRNLSILLLWIVALIGFWLLKTDVIERRADGAAALTEPHGLSEVILDRPLLAVMTFSIAFVFTLSVLIFTARRRPERHLIGRYSDFPAAYLLDAGGRVRPEARPGDVFVARFVPGVSFLYAAEPIDSVPGSILLNELRWLADGGRVLCDDRGWQLMPASPRPHISLVSASRFTQVAFLLSRPSPMWCLPVPVRERWIPPIPRRRRKGIVEAANSAAGGGARSTTGR